MQYQSKQVSYYAVFTFMLLMLSGCAQVQLLADYDKEVSDETIVLAKRVDRFWATYISEVGDAREYAANKREMIEIEVDMNSLLLKNQVRVNNDLTTLQLKNVVDIWAQISTLIKTQESISNTTAEAYRLQLADAIKQIVIGEEAKDKGSAKSDALAEKATYARRSYTLREGSK